jgi:DNA-binding GntR family transcriptional regulator
MDSTAWATAVLDGHRTLAEKAFAAIHEGIVTGALAPGERLRIEELAATLGMSHLPIREAIRRLESIGLAEHIPHRGGRVAELSLADLDSLYEARLLLEPELIARTAQRFSAADAQVAREFLDEQAQAEQRGELRDVWNAHTEFHFSLYRLSDSPWLLRLVTPLWESSQRYRMTVAPLNSERRRQEAQHEHEQMLDACIDHDGDRARRVLHEHLTKTAKLITEDMTAHAAVLEPRA